MDCKPSLSQLKRHLVHVDAQPWRYSCGGGLGCCSLSRSRLSLVRAVHPKRALPAHAEAHAAVASTRAAVLVSVVVHATPAASPLRKAFHSTREQRAMDRGPRSLATAIHRGDAKGRRVMQLRPQLCVVKEVAAVGGKMLFADRGTQQVRPNFAAQIHTLEPVPVLVAQRVGNVRLEGHFLGKEMAGVASAGRAMRQRELSAEAGAVSVAMAGDVDAVAAIDRKQAGCRDTRVVADALAPNKGGHQLLPGQHPLGRAERRGALHLDGLVSSVGPLQVAAFVVPAAILELGAERNEVTTSAL
mmetsp:Transcript_20863/g.52968  ORF Transcript_20863/g.52968 Transcript_20863/m.52968 type:complete len:301 (+) Transcript_20863:1668-2570(+)